MMIDVSLAAWLRDRLGIVSAVERKGISIAAAEAIELPAPRDLARLIRACGMMPAGSILYLEGGAHPQQLRQHLASHQIANPTPVARQTIWPREVVHHLQIDADTIDYLARFAETVAAPEVCMHLIVYNKGRVLVSAPDAPDDPVLVSRHLPEEIIGAFAKQLGRGRDQ